MQCQTSSWLVLVSLIHSVHLCVWVLYILLISGVVLSEIFAFKLVRLKEVGSSLLAWQIEYVLI